MMAHLVADLSAETEDLLQMVAPLEASAWDLPTPAEGWTIRDQISHLAYSDDAARLAATDSEAFRAQALELITLLGESFPDVIAVRYRDLSALALLEWFRVARSALVGVFLSLDPRRRLPWYGPDMSAASSVTARIMETWAHGQDIADTLGIERDATQRLRHIAHLGIQTFAFGFTVHGLEVPEDSVRVELEAPTGALWAWGPEDAGDRVIGNALDFCLVVTQRRHLRDTALSISGATATRWMSIAQVFAGAPGGGRKAGQFARTEQRHP
nr:TIGR03084 family metal-binding protein [Ferrimicrobium sp.]